MYSLYYFVLRKNTFVTENREVYAMSKQDNRQNKGTILPPQTSRREYPERSSPSIDPLSTDTHMTHETYLYYCIIVLKYSNFSFSSDFHFFFCLFRHQSVDGKKWLTSLPQEVSSNRILE